MSSGAMNIVSNLVPGATYIYERADGRTYARIMGSTERVLIGEDYDLEVKRRRQELTDEWMPILEQADTNPALQDALERVKVLYELTRQHNI
jgi:hypothetical protein